MEWSIEYLDNYDEVYHTRQDRRRDGRDDEQVLPDVKAEDFAIHWQARLLFPRSCPDWLTPLPGKPGEIFLNPEGGYDGDPPKE